MNMTALTCPRGRRGITLIARLVPVTLVDSADPEGDCFFVFSNCASRPGSTSSVL